MTADIATHAAGITAAHFTGMVQPLDPRVSPGGQWVAFVAQAASKTKKQKRLPARIWIAPADGSSPAHPWTPDTSRADTPRWSWDGRWLAFLSDRMKEDRAQVYRMRADGGEAEQVTDWQGGVDQLAWSPDGRHITFTAADESWAAERKRREEAGDDADAWTERAGHRRLRVIAADGGPTSTLGPADRHVTGFAWAPSGREVLAVLTRRPDLEAPSEAGVDLVRLPLDGGPARTVCHVPFGAGNPTWTRDGQAILFTAWEAGGIPSSRAVFVAPAEGGPPRCLTAGMQGCALGIERPAESDTILCSVAEGLTTRLYALDPHTGKRSLVYEPPHGSATGEFGISAGGHVVALVRSSSHEPPEVWAGAPAAGLRRVSDANLALAGLPWAAQEPFTWTAPDGWTMDGLLLRPHGHTSPPGVVLVHGGPYGRWADGFNGSPSDWAQWLALDGYAVFMPNPRGGMGHGHAFAATVAGEVGMADWLDVASGTDAFVAAGHADASRLGIGGWSQGGFMTAWAVTGGIGEVLTERGWNAGYSAWRTVRGDRFRCGVDGAGPTDWGSMVSESDVPTFEAMLGGSRPGAGAGPHRHAAVSPLSHAARAHTPLLILHGRDDERVPVGQATGFFHELRRRGVPAEMVLYPREPHGIQETAHQVDMLRRVREWYGRWLRG